MASERPRCKINKRVALGWHARLAVTLLCAGPWGVPGTGQGCRGYPAAASATSTGPAAGLPAPPGSLASPRGVGGRLGSGGGLAEIQASPQPPVQPCGEGESRGPGLESQCRHSLG